MKEETLKLIGLAKRAGKVMSGSYQVEQAIRKRQARLVLVAQDASDNTKKHFRNQCAFRQILLGCTGSKESLGHAIGQKERSCLAITDDNLAAAVRKRLEEEGLSWDQGV